MNQYLYLFLLFPLAAFAVSLFVPKTAEKVMSALALISIAITGIGITGFTVWWLMKGHPVLEIKQFTIYRSEEFEFFIDFYFDKITAVFAITGAALTFLIAVFSKTYMHREEGFKRFFNVLLLFWFGYMLIVMGGNLETLFTGWEVIGISSFLLISFYRDRYLPVRNSLKVISLYRLSDISLILAMWMCHHMWQANITFSDFNDAHELHQQEAHHVGLYWMIAILIVLAAAIKSAQFPFSFWLPRAMEGPTTSSAIFYGSLSVHVGVFLLLRSFPFWENNLSIRILIGTIGVLTALISAVTARTQSTAKGQIAYASSTHIGIIFLEIACGFHWLALFHFAANSFLRAYQLLVSPSLMHYLIHNQFFNFIPDPGANTKSGKLVNTIYMLSIKEWHLDRIFHLYIWDAFKWIGSRFTAAAHWSGLLIFALICVLSIVVLSFVHLIPDHIEEYLPEVYSGMAVLMILIAFSSREDAGRTWLMILTAQIIFFLTFIINGHTHITDLVLYSSGVTMAGITGYFALQSVRRKKHSLTLAVYHGLIKRSPVAATIFLLSGLGLLAFPITTSFIGLDVLFTSVHHSQTTLIILCATYMAFVELAALRIYTRVFLGPSSEIEYPVAFKAS
jgi:NADH:ubiquinone oxidoreductase subunit 5 (subunit L)/multisubunit Na+/H+ antiporter MnhA subunit